MFIMCTKKGKLRPGTEKTIFSFSSWARAELETRGRATERLRSRATASRRVTDRCPRILLSLTRAAGLTGRASLTLLGTDAHCSSPRAHTRGDIRTRPVLLSLREHPAPKLASLLSTPG